MKRFLYILFHRLIYAKLEIIRLNTLHNFHPKDEDFILQNVVNRSAQVSNFVNRFLISAFKIEYAKAIKSNLDRHTKEL